MSLSADTVKRLMIGLTSKEAGNEVANAVNPGQALAAQTGWSLKALITATNVSQTVDFGALVVGDKILQIPATPGNPVMLTCATAGTLPVAAVVSDFYLVFRAYSAPATSNQVF